jgi:hypothetical protein
VSVWVPKTIEDEIACLGLSADLLRGVYVRLRGEVTRHCESGAWPPGGPSERDVSFNLTEMSDAAGLSWHYFTFFLEEVPDTDGRRFDVLEFHHHRDD